MSVKVTSTILFSLCGACRRSVCGRHRCRWPSCATPLDDMFTSFEHSSVGVATFWPVKLKISSLAHQDGLGLIHYSQGLLTTSYRGYVTVFSAVASNSVSHCPIGDGISLPLAEVVGITPQPVTFFEVTLGCRESGAVILVRLIASWQEKPNDQDTGEDMRSEATKRIVIPGWHLQVTPLPQEDHLLRFYGLPRSQLTEIDSTCHWSSARIRAVP